MDYNGRVHEKGERMIINRQRLEQHEIAYLAPYATFSQTSQGRYHHEPEPSYRTSFQRDRDRIVHSAAFRRLEYKTQVFVNDEGDYYRTRLTHTLEVSQIGRTLARTFGVNEDLVEAICLAHDLGHPPFGHAGERVLNELAQEVGGYNHNHQSYRVVTKLEQRYPHWPGLNLTYETLEGMAKHGDDDLSVTLGYVVSLRGSVEAQVASIADELAYNAHDLDDGLQSGLFSPGELEALDIWKQLCERLNWKGAVINETTRHMFIRELVGMAVDDVVQESSHRLTELNPNTVEDVKSAPKNSIAHSQAFTDMNQALKAFLYEHMYFHFRVMRMAKRAERFIHEIFTSYAAEPRQLPTEYQERLKTNPVLRVVTDYLASMTDRGALLEYQRLFDPLTRP